MRYLVLCTFIFSAAYTQTVIGEGLSGMELWNYVIANYKTSSTLGYTKARDTLYSVIDIQEGNQLSCVYSGFTITLDIFQDPSTNAYEQGINCEHTWPQSLGAGSEPMKSDMHHLFPTKSNVNSSRGNDPFEDIPNDDTDKWYRNDYYIETIPTEFIDEYAEKFNPPNQEDERFEPREEQKGNTARAMFYFYTIYVDQTTENYWNLQDQALIDWHFYDLPDETEIDRTNMIASYQGNVNPYVVDISLAGRVFLVSEGILTGDINQDETLDILDAVMDIGYIIDEISLSQTEIIIADMNYDINLDVLDVVSLVEIILN